MIGLYFSLYGALSEEKMACGLEVGHVNIVLYYFTPTHNTFSGIAPGETIRCVFHNKKWTASKSDYMPNWYVASLGMKAKVMKNTVDESISYLGPFDTPVKWKRSEEDQYDPFSSTERYSMYKRDSSSPRPYYIVPTPLRVSVTEGSFVQFDAKTWAVLKSTEFLSEASFIAGK